MLYCTGVGSISLAFASVRRSGTDSADGGNPRPVRGAAVARKAAQQVLATLFSILRKPVESHTAPIRRWHPPIASLFEFCRRRYIVRAIAPNAFAFRHPHPT
jgi:hypothetical protein